MGLFSKIKKAFKKVVKKVAGGIKKVVKGVGKVVKKISKSKLFKAILAAGAIIVTGGAAIGAFGGSLATSGFGSWMVGASQTITGGTLFGTGGGFLAKTGNFLTSTLAKPFASAGKFIGSTAGKLTDLTGLTEEATRMGYKNIGTKAAPNWVVDPSKRFAEAGPWGDFDTSGRLLSDVKAGTDTMFGMGKVVDPTTGKLINTPLPTSTTAAQVATKDTLTGSKWGDFALNTATNLGTSVATGYALNKLTEGDPTGVPTGLAYEGETRLDPLQIYSGGQALSVDGIYQNMMYGTGDPYYQASTELFKQQTVGVPA
jgi:hypothetical protein